VQALARDINIGAGCSQPGQETLVPSQDKRYVRHLPVLLHRVQAGGAAVAAEVGAEEEEEEEEAAGADNHEIQFSGKCHYPLFHARPLFFRRMLYSTNGSVDVDVIGGRKFSTDIYTR
jgi:hypothetical protein